MHATQIKSIIFFPVSGFNPQNIYPMSIDFGDVEHACHYINPEQLNGEPRWDVSEQLAYDPDAVRCELPDLGEITNPIIWRATFNEAIPVDICGNWQEERFAFEMVVTHRKGMHISRNYHLFGFTAPSNEPSNSLSLYITRALVVNAVVGASENGFEEIIRIDGDYHVIVAVNGMDRELKLYDPAGVFQMAESNMVADHASITLGSSMPLIDMRTTVSGSAVKYVRVLDDAPMEYADQVHRAWLTATTDLENGGFMIAQSKDDFIRGALEQVNRPSGWEMGSLGQVLRDFEMSRTDPVTLEEIFQHSNVGDVIAWGIGMPVRANPVNETERSLRIAAKVVDVINALTFWGGYYTLTLTANLSRAGQHVSCQPGEVLPGYKVNKSYETNLTAQVSHVVGVMMSELGIESISMEVDFNLRTSATVTMTIDGEHHVIYRPVFAGGMLTPQIGK